MAISGKNPLVLNAAGDTYSLPVRISAFVYDGANAADAVQEVVDPVTGDLLWACRATTTTVYSDYYSVSFPPNGLDCPNGIKAGTLTTGRILAYVAKK